MRARAACCELLFQQLSGVNRRPGEDRLIVLGSRWLVLLASVGHPELTLLWLL